MFSLMLRFLYKATAPAMAVVPKNAVAIVAGAANWMAAYIDIPVAIRDPNVNRAIFLFSIILNTPLISLSP